MGRAISVSLQTGGGGLNDEYEPESPHVGDVLTDDDPDSPGPGIHHRIAFSRAWRDGETLREYDSETDMLDKLAQIAELVEDDA